MSIPDPSKLKPASLGEIIRVQRVPGPDKSILHSGGYLFQNDPNPVILTAPSEVDESNYTRFLPESAELGLDLTKDGKLAKPAQALYDSSTPPEPQESFTQGEGL